MVYLSVPLCGIAILEPSMVGGYVLVLELTYNFFVSKVMMEDGRKMVNVLVAP